MSAYDIAMIIVFLGAIWFGYWKGLAWQVASVASIALSYFVAITFPDAIAPYISAEAPYNRFAAMLILFIGTSLIVWTIFASISKSLKKMELKGFDRQAGALVGAFKGAILCMVITMFAFSLLGDKARDAIHQSKSGYYVVHGIDQLPAVLPADMYQYVHTYVENFRAGIIDENGNLPTRNPIFTNSPQHANDQGQLMAPGAESQYGQTENSGFTQWQTPASQAGFQRPAANTSGQTRWQGNYQSGTFGNPTSATGGGSLQQGTFGSPQRTQWQHPNQQQFQNQNQTRWQPPARPAQSQSSGWSNQFPQITEGENGWPNVQFNVNSKELLQRGADAALDAGKQWLDNQRQ